MVHFVGPANRLKIKTIAIPEKPESLMNKNIVNEKISKTVNRDADTNPKKIVVIISHYEK